MLPQAAGASDRRMCTRSDPITLVSGPLLTGRNLASQQQRLDADAFGARRGKRHLARSLRELPACSCENRASGLICSARVHECRKRDEGDAAAVI